MKRLIPYLLGILVAAFGARGEDSPATSVYGSSEDFARFARKLRESALSQIEPKVFVPTTSATRGVAGQYPWHNSIVTTVFWVGENAGTNNPVSNHSSSWDAEWASNYGGYDTPEPGGRSNFIPIAFKPRLNPFYIALPYNDIVGSRYKIEAPDVIPWFRQYANREGKSVCQNRWVAIRKGPKVCYAQWSDCGPFRTDHWEYVFGGDRPKPNLNQGAGLDISPAVRDYLGLGPMDTTDWKFVEARDVPPNGPWAVWGENNTVIALRGRSTTALASAATPAPSRLPKGKGTSITIDGPTVITR